MSDGSKLFSHLEVNFFITPTRSDGIYYTCNLGRSDKMHQEENYINDDGDKVLNPSFGHLYNFFYGDETMRKPSNCTDKHQKFMYLLKMSQNQNESDNTDTDLIDHNDPFPSFYGGFSPL